MTFNNGPLIFQFRMFILDSGFYISANETQFNPSGNFTAFSDFPEDVLSVPTEELAVEDASPGQRPLHDADATNPSPSEVQVPVSVDALPSPEQEEDLPLPPASVPTLPPAKRRSKAKKKPVSMPRVSRKRRRTPSPQPSPAKSPIPVLKLFRNYKNDSFMALAKLVRKSRRICEQGMR